MVVTLVFSVVAAFVQSVHESYARIAKSCVTLQWVLPWAICRRRRRVGFAGQRGLVPGCWWWRSAVPGSRVWGAWVGGVPGGGLRRLGAGCKAPRREAGSGPSGG